MRYKNKTLKFSLTFLAASLLLGCGSTELKPSVEPKTNLAASTNTEQPKYDTSPLPTALNEKLENSMVLVEGGKFLMGSDSPEARRREKPVHEVELSDFYISKYEVTQDLYIEVMGWNPSYFHCDDCPLNNLSYTQAEIFLAKLNARTGKNYRFPTEAEWEFAARGGNKSKGYKYSGSDNIDDVAWYSGNANRKAQPVGLKAPNELGLYDMTGNMWEFCSDDFEEKSYMYHDKKDPHVVIDIPRAKIKMKVTRGSGYEYHADESFVFIRDMASDNVRMPDLGLRLAHSK
ncbi:SUMF1/EgtB/PvdO family nonheme iron enzyme [Thalassotalea sp. LPB0316]|uniref:formylglycine-generating enzyme family protein n=1 Tax=Thalassotalea sp. LPB0316 TaxID=2769490 RepID=UPI001866C934|nr:SUMF1/EgtB/PvdO family nonheme iron enzyme [Thalassotalea sp. LPB0316]QOL25340.1 SUMF1/EgtB/PvdO family nonheme iron enzyme [Thalassotalea sp. LPB0316]